MTQRRIFAAWYFVPLLLAVLLLKIQTESKAQTWLSRKPDLDAAQALVFAKGVKRFSLGLDSWVAGLVWIRLLQVASHEPVSDGKLSWEYAQLLTVVELDRHFENAYDFGSSFLSVFRQDREGAKDLLTRWTKERPNHWRPRYHLGYHLFAEMGEPAQASLEILKAAELPGSPPWLSSLGVRLLSDAGAFRYALSVAIRLYPAVAGTEARRRLANRIRALRYHYFKQQWEERIPEFEEKFSHAPANFAELASAFRDEDRGLASVVEPGTVVDSDVEALLAEPIPFRYDAIAKQLRLSDSKLEKEWGRIGVIRPKK